MVQTRLTAKRMVSDKVETNDGAPSTNTTVERLLGDDSPSPAKKRRREDPVAPKKRRRGKPAELCQLNLDVLFLIAKYIHPIDLLSLARTCKSLRELLMDKSSTFVWKTARSQVRGLPDCPADLTEPEYANLVFYARCHGCGKYTTTILWRVRRRYCPGCRIRGLRRLSSCNVIIRKNGVLAVENILVKKEYSTRIDRDQAASFMHEYRQSPDKKQFINDKQQQCSTILQHAKKCEAFQKRRELERKNDREDRQWERVEEIFRRLNQHGYQLEINHFGYHVIEESRRSDFRTSRPLTDKEWDKMWPEWAEIMNNFRSQRLQVDVYQPRRRSLRSAYNSYVASPSPDAPSFDILPHVADMARFLPFRDIIKAPEETQMSDKPFASAFAQLPVLVAEWKKKLDAEVAELVNIPSHLSSEYASSCQALSSSGTARAESLDTDLDKLRLACALFQTKCAGVFSHPDVFSVSMFDRFYPVYEEEDSERVGSILDRFGIQFMEEAPYIVYACSLDPNVATVDNMDRRNARLRCLCCDDSLNIVLSWRGAMWHAYSRHQSPSRLAPLSNSPRWQLVADEHIGAIQTVEQSIENKSFPRSMRCPLCRPHVGDVIRSNRTVACHLHDRHDLCIGENDIKQGVHYVPVGICDSNMVEVVMVEEGDQVTFSLIQSAN